MKSRHGSIHLALTLLVLLMGQIVSRPAAAAEPTQTRAHVQAALQHTPLTFEANQGQTDRRVQFLARGHGYSLFLAPQEAVIVLRKAQKPSLTQRRKDAKRSNVRLPGTVKPLREVGREATSAVLRMRLLGANLYAKASGQERLPGQVNYFLGNNPKLWRANVPTYLKVHYRDVYPEIDLVYYGNQQQLEYDFIVQPGANPRKIALAFSGAQRVRIDKRGELVLKTASGEVRWHKPVVYQQVNGKRKSIAAKYTLLSPEHLNTRTLKYGIGFQVAKYDRTKPLVIDPVLAYSTYLGGSNSDGDYLGASSIAVDAAGYIYVTGTTFSPDFPTRNRYQGDQAHGDVFVTKLDPSQVGAAQLLYSTYLGGSAGFGGNSAESDGFGTAVDATGCVYVTGHTRATDFPTKNAFQSNLKGDRNAFVTKLDTTQTGEASLLYSTYLGGQGRDGGLGAGIVVDGAGFVYVTGFTASFDFPTKNPYQSYSNDSGAYNAFVTKLDTTQAGEASLRYSTYLGGNREDFGQGIAVDAVGNVYVAGITGSSNFPTRNAYQGDQTGWDVFVTKLDITKAGEAQLLYSTYLGGSSHDTARAIAVDAAGYIYVTGAATQNFPTRNAYQGYQGAEDAFVTKLDPTRSGDASLLYSTYLGGRTEDNPPVSASDHGYGIAVDGAGHVYVTGYTQSSDFPTRNAYQGNQGRVDAFVAKLDTNQSGAASLLYSTYLGGNEIDNGSSIVVDAAGNVYVTGTTGSSNFPTSNPYQADQGGYDAFVVKFAEATISGTITLEDCLNPAQPVTFTFRPSDGAAPFSRFLTLHADGTFTLTSLLRKNYQIAIKGAKWLQKVVSVDASNGNVTNVTALLKAGDANNDNLISVDDLAALITAFDADPSSPNWNGGIADFDCNNLVDVEDLALLIQNFDQSGDP